MTKRRLVDSHTLNGSTPGSLLHPPTRPKSTRTTQAQVIFPDTHALTGSPRGAAALCCAAICTTDAMLSFHAASCCCRRAHSGWPNVACMALLMTSLRPGWSILPSTSLRPTARTTHASTCRTPGGIQVLSTQHSALTPHTHVVACQDCTHRTRLCIQQQPSMPQHQAPVNRSRRTAVLMQFFLWHTHSTHIWQCNNTNRRIQDLYTVGIPHRPARQRSPPGQLGCPAPPVSAQS